VIFSVVYLFARALVGCLIVLRHENAVLRRQISRVRYQPGDRLWLSARPG